MKAVGLKRYLPIDHPESLIDFEAEMPHPSGHDLLIKVEALSVNPVDSKVRAPKDQAIEENKILGWDAYGTVVSVGQNVTLFSPGARVYYAGDVTRQGCNSEFHLVDERITGHAPRSLSAAETAALPLTTLTAWEAMFDRMSISISGSEPGSDKPSILIIGAAGGVGSMAIQLAAKVAGLEVIATASRPETKAWCKQMGATHVLDHSTDLLKQLEQLAIPAVEYILCCQSPDQYFDTMVEAVRAQGKICCIVDNTEALAMNKLKAKSVSFSWEFMFTRAMFACPDMIEQHHILNEVSRLVDEGLLCSTLQQTLSPINAANLRTAHERMEQGSMIGKLVIESWN